MLVRLVVNPAASSMTDRRVQFIEVTLGAAHKIETVHTRARDDARDLARAAADEGVDVVVVAAGDGTLNEAGDALVGTGTALAPLPGGSTNVFARAIGYGNNLERVVQRLLRALDRHSIERVGVGVANGRHFLFHLGAGFDAAVVERMERKATVKRYAAHPAFALATIRTLAGGFDRVHPLLRVRANEHDRHESFMTVVSNVVPYTYIGSRRMILTRDAGLDRALALTSFTRFTVADVAAAFASTIGNARHLYRDARIVQRADVTVLEVTAIGAGMGERFPWQVDGDYLGLVDRLTVQSVPEALALVLP